MKVLIHTYNTCFQNPSGGVQVRVKKIKALLEKKGVIVDFFNPTETKLNEYDVLHLYKLDSENSALVDNAKKYNIKVVISPIVNLINGPRIDFYRRFFNHIPISTNYKQIFKMLNVSDMLLVETKSEMKFISKHFGIPKTKIRILPNGVDKDKNNEIKTDIFSIVGENRKYLLYVGRINKNKNIVNLIRAVGPTGICLVIVGGADKMNGQSYYNKCLEEAKPYPNIFMLGWLNNDSDLLISAYQNADTVVLPSFNETFGLTILEGAMYGAKVTFSKTLPILDFDVFKLCNTFDPSNVNDMAKVIKKTFEETNDRELISNLQRDFSWETIIEKQICFYMEVLDEKRNN